MWIEIIFAVVLYLLAGTAWYIGSLFHDAVALLLSFAVTVCYFYIARRVINVFSNGKLPDGSTLDLSNLIAKPKQKQRRKKIVR
jgi:hypothetical protein